MTHVPHGVRPHRATINMLGRGASGTDGQGQDEGGEEVGGDGEQEWQEEELRGFMNAQEDNEDEVADLFGDFDEGDQEEQQQQPRRVRRRQNGAQDTSGGEETCEEFVSDFAN